MWQNEIWLFLPCSTSDVDVTGVTEYSVNNSSYLVVDGSVILPTDEETYPDTDDSSLEIESDDETLEDTERYMCKGTDKNNS